MHAKIYIFDDKKAIITSANLTESGLDKNYEYGIITDEDFIVEKTCEDYRLMLDNQFCGQVNKSNLIEIKRLLNSIPNDSDFLFPEINFEQNEFEGLSLQETYSINIKTIEDSLKGWNLDIFIKINEMNKQVFDLIDLYNFSNEFQKIHPNNHNIEAKIRQCLQNLRNVGLINFLGKGTYQKLWI